MELITTLLAFAVTLGVLITFHEFGHYLVARKCKVKVISFSIGFGRPLVKFTRKNDPDQVEWRISALPLGGYVRMLDERDPKCLPIKPEERDRTFNSKSVWQRIAIVAAGPIFNLILSILLFSSTYMFGVTELLPILATPMKGSAAATAGITGGDEVIAVNGKKVETYGDLRIRLLDKAGQRVLLEVKSPTGSYSEKQLDLSALNIDDTASKDPLEDVGLKVKVGMPIIRAILSGSPAQQAGLKEGEQVLALGGKKVVSLSQMIDEIKRHPNEQLPVVVEDKNGNERTVLVNLTSDVDAEGRTVGKIGIAFGVDLPITTITYNPVESLWAGTAKTWNSVVFSVKMIGKMIIGEVSVKNLSGPVTIADYAGQTARMGVEPFISFLALVSLSLGVLNLLPIPVLDGGHLMYYSVELITGKPVSESFQLAAQKIGIVLLCGLTMLALFNDITRLLS